MSPPRRRVFTEKARALEKVQEEVVRCRRCPRLVEWREKVAKEKVARYTGQQYWGKPVPSFGDPNARLWLIGLAPAAHGGNRTGRMFTGDRSGDWLYRTLYKFGFSNQPSSILRNDGLKLINCYITASARCAPPLNKLLPGELQNCRPFLRKELSALGANAPGMEPAVVIALGKVAFDTFLKTFSELGGQLPRPRPRFSHGVEFHLSTKLTLIASFHPSQQNTFTGKLTEPMFDRVFRRARELLST
ncbi:MAG: uracil-DNA glycosylase [Acidobacteriia bacterium]|nr:uracil-DNA glycosylase [Terriglobia bacterium]